MSQNTITLNTPLGELRLSAGWDRPLQTLFCDMLSLDDVEDDEPEVDETPQAAALWQLSFANFESVAEFEALTKKAGLQLPQTFFEALARDVAENAGNVARAFSVDGSFEETRF